MNNYLFKRHIKGIQHIGIPTDRYSETLEFYKSLGFEVVNQEGVSGNKTAFLRIHNVMLEIYESRQIANRTGSIDHVSLSVEDVDRLYQEMLPEYKVISSKVEKLPYWKNGIRFFKIEGPNQEIIELCEIL